MTILINFINSLPNAIGQGMVWGIMAMGVYITYRILDIADLTVDSSFATGGAICVILIINGMPAIAAVIISFICGLLCGVVTGVLTTKLGIPAILAGILTQLGLFSINLHILGFGTDSGSRANLPISVDKYNLLLSGRYVRKFVAQNPILVTAIFIVVVIGILYWFFGTELGCSLRATGANQNMARAQGINTDTTKIIGLAISNGLVALSGGLFAQFQGFADVSMGRGAIVIGLAAVIIGDVVFSRFLKSFWGQLTTCVLGAIIYYAVITLVLKLGLSTDDLKLLTAIVVAIFLAVPYLRNQYAMTHVKGGK